MNVGIIGAGSIAVKMAKTIARIDGIGNYAVASRTIEKATAFKNEHGFEKAYGSYEELLQDEKVDLVYIATVHSTHYPIMLLCLQYGKPVLCEKIFTTSLKDTLDIYKKFEEKNLFIAEALWTSFLPSRKIINDLLYKEKAIGNIVRMESRFRLPIAEKERIKRKDLGGGSVMDIGVYPISFTFRTLGFDYESFKVSDTLVNELGADIKEVIEFTYKGGIKAVCKIDATSPLSLKVTVQGDNGKLVIDSVNCPCRINVYNAKNRLTTKIDCAPLLGGFEQEIVACKEALERGKIECAEWTHANSIAVSKVVDETLRQVEENGKKKNVSKKRV